MSTIDSYIGSGDTQCRSVHGPTAHIPQPPKIIILTAFYSLIYQPPQMILLPNKLFTKASATCEYAY
jgi:hypothetical protein